MIPPAEKLWSRVDVRGPGECWLWSGCPNAGGYGQFGYGGRRHRPHRTAWRLTFGEIPAGMVVCHSCDQPRCCNPGHLFLGTDADNSRDKVSKGRQWSGSGEQNGRVKMTWENVRWLRWARAYSGASYRRIGLAFGVHKTTAREADIGTYWPGGVQ